MAAIIRVETVASGWSIEIGSGVEAVWTCPLNLTMLYQQADAVATLLGVFDDSRHLLAAVATDFKLLSIEAEAGRQSRTASIRLQQLCKHISSDLMSALDYAASELTGRFAARQPKPMFPILDPRKPIDEYRQVFDSALPGVRGASPAAFRCMGAMQSAVDVQRDAWLWALRLLNNSAKHNDLTSASVERWVHLGSQGVEVFAKQLSLSEGARVGDLIALSTGDFDADNLPPMTAPAGSVIEKVIDFELLVLRCPMEWGLSTLWFHMGAALAQIERAIG